MFLFDGLDPGLLVRCPTRGSLYCYLDFTDDHRPHNRKTGYSNVLGLHGGCQSILSRSPVARLKIGLPMEAIIGILFPNRQCGKSCMQTIPVWVIIARITSEIGDEGWKICFSRSSENPPGPNFRLHFNVRAFQTQLVVHSPAAKSPSSINTLFSVGVLLFFFGYSWEELRLLGVRMISESCPALKSALKTVLINNIWLKKLLLLIPPLKVDWIFRA